MSKPRSGKEWAGLLHISILEPTGWQSADDYEKTPILKAEFCNRAANSRLDTTVMNSRRDATKYAQRRLGPEKK